MKSVKKLLLSLLFLSACNPSVVFADERADTVNVIVPSSIDMVFNNDGTNVISEFGVSNNSLLPLTVNNIGVTAKNNWNLVPTGTSIPKNTRSLSFKMNGVDLVKGDNKMSIPITEGTKKVIPISINRGLWTSSIKESAFDLQVDYSFGVKSFTLSFNTDGGSTVNAISSNNGSKVTLPSSTKTGYTLEGWVDSKGTLYKAGSSYTMPVGGGTLTAKWKANTYNVVFNSNGGSGSMSNQVHTYNSSLALSKNTLTRVGYAFAGWNTKSDGSGTNYTDSQVVSNLSSKNGDTITLYAKWKTVDYTISYNLNGGTASGNPTSYNIETATFTLKNPSKTGNTFTGWTGSNGTTAQTSVSISKGSTGNKSYVANWKVNSYTLTYNANGGSVSPTSKGVQYGSQYGTLPNPTRTGYTFNGWYTSASGGIKVLDTTVMGASNTTIYAQWTPISYSISYNLNGGTNPSSGVTTSYNITSSAITLPTPTKSGYTFSGWYDNSSFSGNKVTSLSTGSTGNKVYYAKWTPSNYTITYNLNGGTASNATSYNIETATFTLKNPTKTGYTFTGWTGSNGSTPQISVSIAKGSTGNKSYTANWKANTYTVKYNGNGATGGTMADTVVTYGVDTPLRKNSFTKTGYSFTGWIAKRQSDSKVRYKNADGSETGWYLEGSQPSGWTYYIYVDENNVYGSSSVDKDIVTMSAQWKANTYTYNVVYKSSSGKSLGTSTVSGTYGSSKSVSAPAKAGYTTPSAQTVSFDSTSSKTITFTYPLINYTISYNLNGGAMPTSERLYYFQDYAYLGAPIYSIIHYDVDLSNAKSIEVLDTSNVFGLEWNINDEYVGDTTFLEIPDNLRKSSSKVYFKWIDQACRNLRPTIKVVNSINNPTSYNVETPTFTLNNPSKSDSIFSGWTGSNGTSAQTSVTIASGSTGNKSYTANWKSNNPVVPTVNTVMYKESPDQDNMKYVYLSGNVGVSASVSDGGTLSYEWDLYYFALGAPSGGGARQPVACKINGLPTNTGLVDITKIATFYNSDEWMMGSEADPFQYGGSLHNAIGGYLTIKNTLGGKTVSTKVWVGDSDQTYKNMYSSAPKGTSITFGKSVSIENINEEFCNTLSKVEDTSTVLEEPNTVEENITIEKNIQNEEDLEISNGFNEVPLINSNPTEEVTDKKEIPIEENILPISEVDK